MNLLKFKHLLASLFICCFGAALHAQKMTIVKGTVTDADTKEPMPFVAVGFVGTPIGAETDLDGSFQLEAKIASDTLEVTFLGYDRQVIFVQQGVRQEINVVLSPTSTILKEVVIKGEKKGYIRNGNPAVDLMKNVIDHKGDNRIEAQAFYEYDKYEKVEFDINNFNPDKLRKKRAMKKFQFMLDYVDTSEINGKPFLPFFIQETSSKFYYRQKPESKKEFSHGVKVTGMKEYIDLEDFTTMIDVLYSKVNILDENVRILDLDFMSPLSRLANATYRFYITDTAATVNNYPCVKVSFMPVNNQNIAFRGDLYIIRDSSYALVKADLGVMRQININFIQDIQLVQEFERKDAVWALSQDKLAIDFAPFKKGTGVFGTREISYKEFLFNQPRQDSIYGGVENVIAVTDAYKKTDEFWDSARHDSLTTKEQGIYQMIDTLQKLPAFRTAINVFSLFFTGYKALGPVDIGPVGAFYSFNPVEGFRLKLAGETNLKFHPKISIGGYAAYGFEDHKMKYGGSILYSFRNDFKVNPKHYVRLLYQHDVNLLGQLLQFSSPDNFFLSFQRGTLDRMFFIDRFQAEYFLELRNNVSGQFTYTNVNRRPIGSLVLNYTDPATQEPQTLPEIRTSEFGLQLRYAPNEQYLQGRSYRLPVYNQYPVFTVNLAVGLEDEMGGQYTYQRASFGLFKRFYMSLFGTLKLEAEVGKIWGDGLPYMLLQLPRANQSYAYRSNSFNMMNYMEFVNDEYFTWNTEHFFNGFFFNKIPLLRKLKLREVITFKGVYGRLTDRNNPNKHPEFVQFLRNPDDETRPDTYTLEDKPYMEASVGVANIAKFLRVDFVRRLTYLDNPDVPTMFGVKGLGLRIKIKFEF